MIGAAMLFGTTGTAQALGPANSNPLSVGAVRQVIGGGLLAVIGVVAWLRRYCRRPPTLAAAANGKLGWVLLGGGCVMAFQATFFFGTRSNGVAVGTVVALGSSPLFAGLFDWLAGRRPHRRWLLATTISVIGLALLAGLGGGVTLAPLGVALSLAAGAAYAGYAFCAAALLRRGLDSLISTCALLATSAVLAGLILPFTDNSWLASGPGLAMAFWLGVVTVVTSYLLMGTALRDLSAATAITLGLAEPATAATLGVVVLGEHLVAGQWLGLAAVLVGLLVAGAAATGSTNRRGGPTKESYGTAPSPVTSDAAPAGSRSDPPIRA